MILEFYDYWQQIVVVVAVLSLLIGALGAIMQNNIKRLLAYSTINHIGFMLIGLLVFNNDGLMSFLLYSILYLTMVLGAFAFILVTKQCHQSANSADKKSLENLTSFAGLAKSAPLVALAFACLLLSLAGIPPFAGFFAKFFVLAAAIKEGYNFLAFLAVISAVIACFYYLKIIKIMYFDCETEIFNKRATFPVCAVLAVTSLFNFLFFLSPVSLISIVKIAADSIF